MITQSKGLLLGGTWQAGEGPDMASHDPASGEPVWRGREASPAQVAAALDAARRAQPAWARTPFERRAAALERFTLELATHKDSLARALSEENGKPMWESLLEVGQMIQKASLSVDAYRERCPEKRRVVEGGQAITRFRPLGVAAVLGPFNFPGHVPNGHIMPALLAGNTVVFKPSEQTPRFAELTVDLWARSGLPAGVLNLVQGGPATGAALADPERIDALYFTGGARAGAALHRRFADHPGVLLALEMGGNNPLAALDPLDPDAGAAVVFLSAFLSSGQRCTCARRLLLTRSPQGDALLTRLTQLVSEVHVGPCTQIPEPFMGPVISPRAAQAVLHRQAELLTSGARAIAPCVALPSPGGALLRPGLLAVSEVNAPEDVEVFGPLLQVTRVDGVEHAIELANRTRFGLSAGLAGGTPDTWARFQSEVRAGVLAWNRPTTGASSHNPFGGLRDSGNHRPAGFFSADYCSAATGSVESDCASMPSLPPGLVVHRS